MTLKGRTALVTGGNRGIGFEVCQQLAAEGARVLLGSREIKQGTAAAKTIGENVEAVQVDVSDRKSILNFLNGLKTHVDVLVNSAAVIDRGNDVFDLDDEELQCIIRTNLIGPVMLGKYLGAEMKKRKWGRIVNVSSGMGAISHGLGTDSPAYRLSKLAINGLTMMLAASLRGSGVLVNSVDPGWVRTDMGGPSATRSPEAGASSIVWAVLIPDNGPTGGFFRDGKRLEW